MKNIIIAKYQREKEPFTQTHIFDEISKTIQSDILLKTALPIEECLIIGFVNDENWFLLSLDRVIINQHKKYEEIRYSVITKVEPDIDLNRLNKSGPYKIDKIKIICGLYQKIIDVEPGSWGVLVSIFLYFISLNKNKVRNDNTSN